MFINIKGIYFRYKNSREDVLKDFHLTINKGEVVSILGESGSGKSTILRIIAGLELPSKGSISINGNIVVSDSIFTLPENRGVGMVFQDYALFPHMNVEDNIKFGLKKLSRKEKENRLVNMLELVHLEEYRKRYPHELSGGQQQRVAIARALAPKPSLLLLDEPFSNLDSHLKNSIREELKLILNKTGITSIFVTHDVEDAKIISDKVVVLKEGEIKVIGKTEQVI